MTSQDPPRWRDPFGWIDPQTTPITLVYRRKGERIEESFTGTIFVLGEDKTNLTATAIPRAELGERIIRLDLTRVPVICVGGARWQQISRVLQVLNENPRFQGAFRLCAERIAEPGGGALVVTSRNIVFNSQ